MSDASEEMPDNGVNGRSNGHAAAFNGATIETPEPKRSRGRPKGSRNRVGRDARSLMAKHSGPAIRAACKLAAGEAVKVTGSDGSKRVLEPTIGDMINAQRLVLAKLVPDLKATELDLSATVNSTSRNSGLYDWYLHAGDTEGGLTAVETLEKRIAMIRERLPELSPQDRVDALAELPPHVIGIHPGDRNL